MSGLRTGAAAIALLLLAATPSRAQEDEGAAIAVGAFTSERTCTTYVLSWGRETASGASASSGYASSSAAAASSAASGAGGSSAAAAAASSAASGYSTSSRYSWEREWGQELVRDCQANFRGMREALEAALTASGKFTVARTSPGPGTLILTGRVSDMGFASAGFDAGSVASRTDRVLASVNYSLADRGGDTVFGNMLTETLPVGGATNTPGMVSASVQSGRTLYTQLQREVAMGIARDVAFKMFPPRISAVTAGRIALNYNSQFIPLGTVVYVTAPNGVSTIKCVVAPGAGNYATAVPDGPGDLAQAVVGSIVTVVDADDPAAQGRRTQRVDLPR